MYMDNLYWEWTSLDNPWMSIVTTVYRDTLPEGDIGNGHPLTIHGCQSNYGVQGYFA